MPSSSYIQIEKLQWGQPRPYADTIHEVRITFTRDDWRVQKDPTVPKPIIPAPKSKEEASEYLRLAIGPYKTKEEERGWWEQELQEFTQEQPHIWHALAVTRYMD